MVGLVFFPFMVLKHNYFLMFQISEDFEEVPVQSRGFGILDVGYRSKVTQLLIDDMDMTHCT